MTSEIKENGLRFLVHQKKVKNNQVTALHLMVGLLLFILGLVTWAVPSTLKTKEYLFLDQLGLFYSLFGIVIILISIFFNKKIIQTKKSDVLRILEIIALSTISIYSFYKNWYLPGVYTITALIAIAFAYFWEKKYREDQLLTFTNDGVLLPTFLKNKIINWEDINNIIIKHKVLTIDCKDNKLIQYTISQDYQYTNEELNHYISRNLEEKAHLYKKDW